MLQIILKKINRHPGRLAIAALGSTSLLFALLNPLTAFAHAAFVSADPAPNTVYKTAPTIVTIHFAQNLDPQGLSITVYDNKGKVVSTGNAQVSFSDPKTASVNMTADDSDIYRVDWQNVSAEDGDPTLGAYVFGVDPSGQNDKVPLNPYGNAPTTSSSPAGYQLWELVACGVAGLIVGGGIVSGILAARKK